MALVVTKYDGALKAEHGTGRNMAPFVEAEWGPEAYGVMKRLKELADPEGLLNPGVVVNADPRAHLRHLKPLPSVEEEVDRCIECGFCEPFCPSRELTLTPRQRIVVRRQLARLEGTGADPDLRAALEADFPYEALDTCAVDGLCATACPVKIDTGTLTKRFRAARHSRAAKRAAAFVARRFGLVEPLLRAGLRAGHAVQSVFGTGSMPAATRALRALSEGIPLWSAEMPRAAGGIPKTRALGAEAVYFPSCISRTMGALPGEAPEPSLMEAVVALAARAGVARLPSRTTLWGPAAVCRSRRRDTSRHTPSPRTAPSSGSSGRSGNGALPVFTDASPCTYGLLHSRDALMEANRAKLEAMTILDSVAFVHDRLLPKLTVVRKEPSAVLHPVCSVTKMGLTPKLDAVAHAAADKVIVPLDAGCCGFAGDRGFLVPELTASATRLEAREARIAEAAGYWSSSRTCEIGMTRASGQLYRSFVFLLEKATRPSDAS